MERVEVARRFEAAPETVWRRYTDHVSWKEWAEHLSAEIAAAQAQGDPDRGDTYYHHWLAALEGLVAEKDLASATELATRKRQWDVAARNTPHGQPIKLD